MTRNKFEQSYLETLDNTWEYEPKGFKLPYVVQKNYEPDFVNFEDKIIRETKGFWRAEDRAKIKNVIKSHPDWTIIMVFQNPDKTITKTSKTTYGQWCDSNGIKWEHFVPVKPTKQRSKKKIKEVNGKDGKCDSQCT